ncbi:SRPBCC family protein [Pontibacter roseus]|uniref:SRPBCC family protein n=1 Tax=Pontibacter roseus TaxID=336989 RepID=UPI0003720AAC|nr:SRPBCC domain-containing protein [Pontibacter roseus]
METLKIKKSIEIQAPSQQVWEVLVNDDLNRLWLGEFSEGSYAETGWRQGSKVVFKDKSNSGMIGRVAVSRPYEAIEVEYEGMVIAGVEDYASEEARQVQGGRETYYLIEKDGRTRLEIESDMSEEYFDQMSLAWEKALQQIRQLVEKKEAAITDTPTN